MPELVRQTLHYTLIPAVFVVLWMFAQTKRDASRFVGSWREGSDPGSMRTGNPYARTDAKYQALIARLHESGADEDALEGDDNAAAAARPDRTLPLDARAGADAEPFPD